MTLALALFAIAAVGGVLLAYLRIANKPLPFPLALLHGALAASGLIVLALSVFGGKGAGNAGLALGLFVLAALGGFGLFSFHLRKLTLPLPVVVIHGLVAVVAFLILLASVVAAG
jgi:hypothetical protein